jgi:hypothetical protein
MHFLRNLLSFAPFILYGMDDSLPAGFKYVATKRGNRVVTARNSFVIAKG